MEALAPRCPAGEHREVLRFGIARLGRRSEHEVRLDDRRLVPYIGLHQLDPAVPVEPPEEGGAVGMAHAHTHTHVVPRGGQVFHDPAAEESRSPENRH